jgi:hypothetical protein
MAAHVSVEALRERYRSALDPVAKSHFQVVFLLAKGHGMATVAEVVAMTPRWVRTVAARYNAEGPDALGDRRRRNAGGQPLLSADDLAALRDRRATPPDDGGLWTSAKVAAWIAARRRDGPRPARRGGLEQARLLDSDAAPAPSAGGDAGGAGSVQKNLGEAVAEEAAPHPDKPVEVFTTDEHRIGLKPVLRRIWAPVGERPIALGHHRYEWLSVTAFVQPTRGETSGTSRTASTKPSSRRSSPRSPKRREPDGRGSSCWSSTTPAGTAPPD